MQHAGYIDGTFVRGEGRVIQVRNPSDASELARFPGLTSSQIESAITAASTAFRGRVWSERSARERGQSLTRFADALASREAQITSLVVSEAGCPGHSGVMHAQVKAPLRHAREIIELFLSLPDLEDNPLPLAERISALGQTVQSLRRYTPIGVVAAIAAYNFPFFTALWKVMPALIAGNTVVLRPSPLTPLSALLFAEAARDAELPAGVLNVVLEAGIEGAQLLTSHPAVDMVAFTGSSAVGTQVLAQAAPTMKRAQLELGGKSAQVFLPDALERVVPTAVGVCTAHAAQGCALGTRLLVPEASEAQLLEQIARAFAQLRIGPAHERTTQLGPLISAEQVARCEHFVALAQQHGARLVTGGKRPVQPDTGYYFEPTLLAVADPSNPAAQEEIFGPVLCVIGYRDLDHAVELANDSRYGLSGYVHGADRRQALQVATRIRSGTVNVNSGLLSTYVSSGGQRASGVGRERGVEGLRLYQQLSCLNLGG